jgi:hypothetical protein
VTPGSKGAKLCSAGAWQTSHFKQLSTFKFLPATYISIEILVNVRKGTCFLLKEHCNILRELLQSVCF